MFDPSGNSLTSNRATAEYAQVGTHGENAMSILWRFRWLFAAIIPVSLAVGYALHRSQPTTYRATTQLMLKSDKPLALETSTGLVVGGIPSGKLIESLIGSDAILGEVIQDERLRAVFPVRRVKREAFIGMIRSGVKFQMVTGRADSRDRMIGELMFDGKDPRVCVAAVNAVSSAIRQYFKDEREASVEEFGKLISGAQSKLLPKQIRLEADYQAFRDSVSLEWDPDGVVVNPHRQRQAQLQNRQAELLDEISELDSEYRFTISTQERVEDPLMVEMVLSQRYAADYQSSVGDTPSIANLAAHDLELQRIAVKQKMVPLEIRREQLQSQFGDSHPEVRSISLQIESSQKRLHELNGMVASRREQLTSEHHLGNNEPISLEARRAQADFAIEAYIRGLLERLKIRRDDLVALENQIATAKSSADELKKAEETDASFRRRIAGIQGMLIQLEQKLSELSLVDANGGIHVSALLDTGKAFVTGPNLKKNLSLYGLLGVAVSTLLAILMEATAKTFRTEQEIQTTLGLPVLTHIPVDPMTGFVKPEMNDLDESLTVIHRPHSPAAESVRTIRTATVFEKRQQDCKVFQVTSPLPGDGKSTIAANVGCSLALTGQRTLVVDLDLRSPKLSSRFRLDDAMGLTNVLNEEVDISEAIHRSPVEHLDILPCGPLPSNPAEALTLAKLGEVFQMARAKYDYVIVDTPPLLMVSDPTIVTSHVDAALLVMRICRYSKPNAKEAISILRWSGTRVAGVIVNKLKIGKGFAGYQCSASGVYQSYGYGYGDVYRQRYQSASDGRDAFVVRGASGAVRRIDVTTHRDSPNRDRNDS
ncbi:MAG: polysaccharide biosynthesis tyrosine autokinase [Planctomycetota bacterium]